jgi:hypothetical protein
MKSYTLIVTCARSIVKILYLDKIGCSNINIYGTIK